MRSTRVVAVGAVVALACMVVAAVLLVTTSPGAPAIVASDLRVGTGPPTTATGVLTYSDSSGITARADCAFNFADGTAQVTASASLSVVTIDVEARLVDHVIYLSVAQFASLVGDPWLSLGAAHGTERLSALASAMRHPDLARLHPKHETVVHSSTGVTTTALSFGVVNVPFATSLPISVPSPARLTAVVMTGAQGQLLAARVRLVNPGEQSTLAFQVTGYDVLVSVPAPPADQVTHLTPKRAQELFGTDAPGVERLLRGLRRVAG